VRLLCQQHAQAKHLMATAGEVKVPEVMFPGGSPHLVEPIYKDPNLSAPFNEQLASIVLAHCRRRLPSLRPGEKIRIVEIGSGSGGTSAVVLAALSAAGGGAAAGIRTAAAAAADNGAAAPADAEFLEGLLDRLEFVYTDISPQLVAYGRKTYGPAHPYARFWLLDVERHVEAQASPRIL